MLSERTDAFVSFEDVETSAIRIRLRKEISQDVYLGYELHAVKKLFPKLPKNHTTFDDALAWFRLYALEAADMYDPSSAASFTTFLYKHLSIRSHQDFNYAWSKTRQPSSWVFNFSHFERDINGERQWEPARVNCTTGLRWEIGDLLSKMSARSSQLLQWMLDVMTDAQLGPGLLACFESDRNVREVQKYTGLSEDEITTLVDEVRQLAPLTVSGFGNG